MKNATINAPKVFIGDASKKKLASYHLIIYQVSLQAMFIPDPIFLSQKKMLLWRYFMPRVLIILLY